MSQVWVLLIAFAVAVAATGLLSIQFALGRIWSRLAWPLIAVLAAGYCLAAADSLRVAELFRLERGIAVLCQAAIIVVAAVAVIMLLKAGSWLLKSPSAGTKRAKLTALVMCQLVVAGWAGWRLWEVAVTTNTLPMLGSLDLEAIPGEGLLTDKGRVIPVYRSLIAPNLARYVETADPAYANRRIQRAARDEQSNCHGWVFTGGQYLLKGNDVELILADNDYHLTTQPRAGDVIVYRDAFKQVLHTGLVRVADEDGTVLIESKWGIDERFLHLPEDQHYSQRFSYYHRQDSSQRQELLAADGRSPHLVQAVRILPGNKLVLQRPNEALVAGSRPGEATEETWANDMLPPPEGYPMGAE
jgi:hypothetical protein